VEGLAGAIEEALNASEKAPAPPLFRAERDGARGRRFPLSFAQQRLWFIDQLEPGNPAYNIPGAVRLEGRLNVQALESVINEIVRRHEALRTRFEVEAGEPSQVIDEWRPRKLMVEDLSGLPQEVREEEVNRIAREEARTGFNLSTGPLLRVKVLKLGDEDHVALYTMSHIVSDGWSKEILIREVGALYRAYSRGEESPLEEAPIQYADFALWQRSWLQGEALERQIRYWREQLDGLEPLELPTDYPRPRVASYRGNRVPISISENVTSKLVKLSRQEGVTLFMTLLAAINVLLKRHTGQEDIAVGANIANRNKPELEKIIGFFVNNLVLRTDLSGNPTFRELLNRVRDVALNAYAHQDLPFEKLVEELHPQRELGRSPLFQVSFVFENIPAASLQSDGLSFNAIEVDSETSKLDLTILMEETDLRLAGAIRYNTDLFDAATIRRMRDHFQTLLAGVAADPGKPISSYSLAPQSQSDDIINDLITDFNALRDPLV
jgi:condensation domain-containing protein